MLASLNRISCISREWKVFFINLIVSKEISPNSDSVCSVLLCVPYHDKVQKLNIYRLCSIHIEFIIPICLISQAGIYHLRRVIFLKISGYFIRCCAINHKFICCNRKAKILDKSAFVYLNRLFETSALKFQCCHCQYCCC